MALDQEHIVRTLLAARTRISASVWVIARDASATEDIFQNVSVKALAGQARFEEEAQLVSWAYITARHEALNWVRARKNQAVVLDEAVLEVLETEWANEAAPAGGPRVDALRDCLEALPEHSRNMLEMRYFEGRSCQEVSKTIGVSLQAVYQRLSRLHRALRECVEERLAEGEPGLTLEGS